MPFKRNNPGCGCCTEYKPCGWCDLIPTRLMMTYELRHYLANGTVCDRPLFSSQWMQGILERVEGPTLTGAASPGYWIGGCTAPIQVTAVYGAYSPDVTPPDAPIDPDLPYIATQYYRVIVYCNGNNLDRGKPTLLIGMKVYSHPNDCLADTNGIGPPYGITFPGIRFSTYHATREAFSCDPFRLLWRRWNTSLDCTNYYEKYFERIELIEI